METVMERQVWITRYVLSIGLVERHMMVKIDQQGVRHAYPLEQHNTCEAYHGEDVWLDRPGAVLHARQVIAKRRATLERAALKLAMIDAALDNDPGISGRHLTLQRALTRVRR